jgi:lipopolysaccharide transport system ATP-binding protein
MSSVIQAEHISKQYKLGFVGMSSLADDIQRLMAKLKGNEDPFLKVGEENKRDKTSMQKDSKYVWALRNINFNINQGDIVGIIGKNGAGKSTLLKILSRVTEPTKGRLRYKGRLASLLEVGTGFHPDLSGRDNVFLNGAILGMKRHEIASKLNEIIEFSGVEKYIDTPVKRYSSGMYVRLAFAVAAHLEPDILVIDEVLAVGDIEFQEKCIGKMKDVAGNGRTVLFVSHNMAAVKSLCHRAMVLQDGALAYDGTVSDGIAHYLSGLNAGVNRGQIEPHHRTINTGKVFYRRIQIINPEFINGNVIYFNETISIKCEIEFLEYYSNVMFDIRIMSIEGIELAHTMNAYNNGFYNVTSNRVNFELDVENAFQPGKYFLTFGAHLSDGLTLDYLEHVVEINVLNVSKNNSTGIIYDFKLGYVRPNATWRII